MRKKIPLGRRRRQPIIVTEFAVEVRDDHVDWGGADEFLAWLLRQRPEGGFARHARALNRLGRALRRR